MELTTNQLRHWNTHIPKPGTLILCFQFDPPDANGKWQEVNLHLPADQALEMLRRMGRQAEIALNLVEGSDSEN